MTIEQQACQNTDRELWRRDGGEACDPDNFYQPSIHVTKDGAIGINVGGYVYVKPVEEWHKLAGGKEAMQPKELLTSNPLVAKLRKAAVGRSDLCIAPIFVREIVKAADEIERLTALVDGGKQCVKFLEAAEAERDRLTATVEELRTVSAGLRAALKEAEAKLLRMGMLQCSECDAWLRVAWRRCFGRGDMV